MPFKSKAQQGFMFAKKPKLAKEFAANTPSFGKLPGHVGDAPPKPYGTLMSKLDEYRKKARSFG